MHLCSRSPQSLKARSNSFLRRRRDT
uniref:Uncharacterized protein n=1 Tax=Setaria italica TaxID=4555 RepID=K3ZZK7_SETIT